MKHLFMFLTLCFLLTGPRTSAAASARCVVMKQNGTVLTLECGKRATGFPKGTKVKIKTDRDDS